MGWLTGILVYVVIWWLVIFTVLPWGVRPPETVEPGHAESAPERPRMWLKVGVTTVIAAIVWAGIYWAVDSDLFSFRPD